MRTEFIQTWVGMELPPKKLAQKPQCKGGEQKVVIPKDPIQLNARSENDLVSPAGEYEQHSTQSSSSYPAMWPAQAMAPRSDYRLVPERQTAEMRSASISLERNRVAEHEAGAAEER